MTAPHERLAAALADRYRIERELGTGGMSTVYLAHDVRHERPVALKVLRPELAAIIGADRFLAEIKTTAHLQHPHILGLIDSGEVNGTAFYVMPFVRGESLRERLNREQQLPIADAVRIATQVAGALDYAHRQGVIHRDIKPENVLLHDDQALVADFGIALALSRPGDQKRMTETGLSLGTPQYMSPEQAAGDRNLDARTDVYALGSVLYEMLAGEPPFTGPNAHAVISKVISMEPQPVSALRRSVPRNVAGATMVALSKVPADRFAGASAFAAALADARYTAPQAAAARVASAVPTVGLGSVVSIAALAVLAVVAAWGWLRPAPEIPGIVARFQITIPDSIAPGGGGFSLSHDGRRISWTNSGGLYERSVDSLGVRRVGDAIPGGRDASPDGRYLLATTGRGSVSIVPLDGTPARTFRVGGRGGQTSFATFTADNAAYWSFVGDSTRGVVSATYASETPDTVAVIDADFGPAGFAILPGGRNLVMSVDSGSTGEYTLRAYDASTRAWKPLGTGGPLVHFVAPGYLLYSSGQTVFAAPFDARRLELTGQPVRLAESAGGNINRMAVRGGVLVYSAPDPNGTTGLTLRARDGAPRATPNTIDTLVFSQFAVSPDGRRIAATGVPPGGRGGPGQPSERLYVYPLPIGPMQRLQSDERESAPAWIPPGTELSFVRVADSTFLLRRAWDGSGSVSRLFALPPAGGRGRGGPRIGIASWLPDGRAVVLAVVMPPDSGTSEPNQGRGGGGGGRGLGAPSDLFQLSMTRPGVLVPILRTEFREAEPAVSPDGSLLAYVSTESGRAEVYVTRIDGSARRQVSLAGGDLPRWGSSGRQLYFRLADTLFSARVTTSPELSIGAIGRVFSGALAGGYAVLPGDTLFVTRRSDPTPPPLNVITNVDLLLARLFASPRN